MEVWSEMQAGPKVEARDLTELY